jgi:hypothetical protein
MHVLRIILVTGWLCAFTGCEDDPAPDNIPQYPKIISDCSDKEAWFEDSARFYSSFPVFLITDDTDITIADLPCGPPVRIKTSIHSSSVIPFQRDCRSPEHLVRGPAWERYPPISLSSMYVDTTQLIPVTLRIVSIDFEDMPVVHTCTRAYPVFIKNTSPDTVRCSDSPAFSVQFKNDRNEWRDCGIPESGCGAGGEVVWIAPEQYAICFMPVMNGRKVREFRITHNSDTLSSNSFFMHTNF